ncbi:FKBP-type peptidyl-prolyl cis-trans isomerase [Spirosoma agri]|uniref:Peptidyl-prolyl cis-trans isomerase n=1 Tax=Spirosoma agri TaxID=1987381 RepID=A0A6M0IPD8_9BACT|nr:FKBP-type peptidyl-prolyl cis-trans isomerase [Spirosoma agri]NEU68783.1 FKBP-type peptidylprolyl isomerase [Spirosoma agri]
MRTFHLTIWSALLISGLAACGKQDVDPSSTYYDQNDADIQSYATKNNLNGKTTATGLYYVITQANPTGKLATRNEEVEFTYKAYNLGGAVVDSTVNGRPVYYPLGIQSILPGLEEGLALMHEGEKSTLLLPSYLAYGNSALNANLPAYSVVRFDVQLNRSRSEEQQIRQYIADKKLVVTDSSTTGLKIIKTVSNPTGAALSNTSGQTVTIKYKGKQLRSASAFDSTGTGTFDAILGQNRYVKGFEEGLSKLRVGEQATIVFPSSIGYGTTGVVTNNRYVITPYAPLQFELEVVSVK